jgi:hypothetical protein
MNTPSSDRRQALRRADEGNSIRISNDVPLERFYDISKRLLSRFQEAFDQRHLDEAYVYGVRFASLCVDAIPKHASYQHSRFARQRKDVGQKCDQVLKLLDIVRQRMDAEEILNEQAAEDERKKNRQQQLEEARLKEQEQEKEQQQQEVDVKKSALAKLSAMQSQIRITPKKKEPTKIEKRQQVHGTQPSLPVEINLQDQKSGQAATTKDKTVNKARQQGRPLAKKRDKNNNLSVQTVNTATQKSTRNEDSSSDATTVTATPTKTPRRQQEERTIDLLQESIEAQENRLQEIEQVFIPKLLQKAKKEHTTAKSCKNPSERTLHRKAALHCVAKKRKLEKQLETIKAAIFHMETQTFLLENAMEDRQITKAMEEANQAMHSLEESVGVPDLANLSTLLAPTTPELGEEATEQELLEELEEWLDVSTSTGKTQETGTLSDEHYDDDVSILSLPQVPKQHSNTPVSAKGKEKRVRKLVKAVL